MKAAEAVTGVNAAVHAPAAVVVAEVVFEEEAVVVFELTLAVVLILVVLEVVRLAVVDSVVVAEPVPGRHCEYPC